MKALKIGFDAKRIYNNTTGLGVYGRSLVRNLAKEFPENEYLLYTPSKTDRFYTITNNFKIITPKTPFHSYWRSYGINKSIAKQHLDIFHGLSNEIPLKLNPTTKYVCTIHDLIWLKIPQTYKAIDRYFYTQKLKHACHHCDMIIATSNQTANDLKELMKVSDDRIKVIYQSGTEVPIHISQTPPIEEPYFFYLSSFQQRKNHLTLLQAYANIKNKSNRMLVLAGQEGETLVEVKNFITKYKLHADVKVITNLTEIDKYHWLAHADAFIYPSSYEGFGIPLLEAMQLGKPLILNDIPVFREIAGNLAQYFSLIDNNSLENILSDFSAQQFISTKPIGLPEKFSPIFTSKQLQHTYLELL